MRLNKQKILDLQNGLTSVGNLTGVRFAYAVVKNLNILQPEIEAIQKAYTPTPEYNAFDNERIKLAQSHAVKKNGIPQKETVDGVLSYVPADINKFEKDFKELQIKYKTAIEGREKQLKEFNELMKEEIDVNLVKISSKDIPEGISVDQLNGIMPIITDNSNTN